MGERVYVCVYIYVDGCMAACPGWSKLWRKCGELRGPPPRLLGDRGVCQPISCCFCQELLHPLGLRVARRLRRRRLLEAKREEEALTDASGGGWCYYNHSCLRRSCLPRSAATGPTLLSAARTSWSRSERLLLDMNSRESQRQITTSRSEL